MALQTTEISQVQIDGNKEYNLADNVARQSYKGYNILHNWYLCSLNNFPIDQRGNANPYTTTGFCMDRWNVITAGTVTKTSGGLYLSNGVYLNQTIENARSVYDGKKLVASILLTTGSLISCEGTINAESTASWAASSSVVDGYRIILVNSGTSLVFQIRSTNTTTSNKIIACKLEQGATQTLAYSTNGTTYTLMDPIPNYGEELLRCLQSKADVADPYSNVSIDFHTLIAKNEPRTTRAANDPVYNVGDYFSMDGTLYRTTSQISTAITPNTNCVATSVGEELARNRFYKITSSTSANATSPSITVLNQTPYLIIVIAYNSSNVLCELGYLFFRASTTMVYTSMFSSTNIANYMSVTRTANFTIQFTAKPYNSKATTVYAYMTKLA